MVETGTGRRIAHWRRHRGLTQVEFAHLMERSVRWVEDLEGGRRQSDPRLSTLERAAAVLHIRLERLLPDAPVDAGVRAHPRTVAPDAPPARIRAALRRTEVLTGLGPDAPADLEQLRRGLEHGWAAYRASDYAGLERSVPLLLTDGVRAVRACQGPELREAYRLLSTVHRLAGTVCGTLGDPLSAWQAADRAVTAAGHSRDPLALAGAAYPLVRAMAELGGADAAVEFARDLTGRLDAGLAARGPAGLDAAALLRLGGAVAAAADGDREAALGLLAEAERLKTGDGSEDDFHGYGRTAARPAVVAAHRVTVLLLLHDPAGAVDTEGRISAGERASLARGRRAGLLVERATALARLGRRAEALAALRGAVAEAPQEVRLRPDAAGLLEQLGGGTGGGAQLSGPA